MIVNSVFAQSVALKKDDKAPFDGVLIDNQKANQLKNHEEQLDSVVKINSYLIQLNDLKDKNSDLDAKKLQLLSTQNDKLAKDLQESKSTSTIEKILYISIGVVATGLGGLALSKLK